MRMNKFSEIQVNNVEYFSSCEEMGSERIFKKDGKIFIILKGNAFDVSYISLLPQLQEYLVIGIFDYIRHIGRTSQISFISCFKLGLFSYISTNGFLNYKFEELDVAFWNGYIKWLYSLEDKNGEKLKATTIAQRYSVARQIFLSLSKNEKFYREAKNIYSKIPQPNFSRGKDSIARGRLERSQLEKIVGAAGKEFIEVRERIHKGLDAIRVGKKYNNHFGIDYDLLNFNSILSYLVNLYPGVVDRNAKFLHDHPVFYEEVRKKFGGTSRLIDYLYLSPRDCIGAVLLLSFAFAMNTETVLTLDFSDIDEVDILGKKYLIIKGKKERASEDVVYPVGKDFQVYKDISIGDLLDFFKIINTKLKDLVHPKHSSRVFLFVNKSRDPIPSSFGISRASVNRLACVDIKFTRNLKEFIKVNDLVYFSHSQIRTTVLDDLYVKTGDIKKVQELGQQKNPWTLLNHYTSDGTKKRLEESLGKSAYLLRERWWKSDGVIDPRASRLGFSGGAGAATPGFYCLDPFDSPMPGQRKNSLCEAYGECPDCMLCAGSDDIQDVANYLALKKQITNAIVEHGEEVWTARWKKIFLSLNQLLNCFDESTIKSADAYQIKLPNLPKLD